MKYKAGFIGVGNMGGALLDAVRGSVDCGDVAIYDISSDAVKKKSDAGLGIPSDIETVAGECDFVFLGVKPNVIASVADTVSPYLKEDTVLVSMAAGVSVADIKAASRHDRVIRIMPNTPASVGEGMILYCLSEKVSAEDEKGFLDIMKAAGRLDRIEEKHIDAASAVSGCGPAFVFMFIEALADGGVRCGLPRDKALLYAEQTLLGSAKLALESGVHPEKLKDMVCSPGGTTIEGVLALEKGSFRGVAASAVVSAFEKTKLL